MLTQGNLQVYAEATVVFPMIVASTFAKVA
jgi:deoxyhypusine synthase